LQGNSIPLVNNETHLGHLFGSDPDIFSQSVKQAVCSMFSKLNLLLRQFIKADCDLKYHLYKLYCLSVYGCQLWDFESPKVSAFFISWRKSVRRIYCLPPRTHCQLLPYICCDTNIDVQLHKRFTRFIFNAIHSNNECVSLACRLALHGSRSAVCNSINYVCHKYHLNKYISFYDTYPPTLKVVDDEDLVRVASVVRDFVCLRQSENTDNVNDIIEFLCVN